MMYAPLYITYGHWWLFNWARLTRAGGEKQSDLDPRHEFEYHLSVVMSGIGPVTRWPVSGARCLAIRHKASIQWLMSYSFNNKKWTYPQKRVSFSKSQIRKKFHFWFRDRKLLSRQSVAINSIKPKISQKYPRFFLGWSHCFTWTWIQVTRVMWVVSEGVGLSLFDKIPHTLLNNT